MVLARQLQGTGSSTWNMLENLNRNLDRFFGEGSKGGSLLGTVGSWTPRTDVYESDGKQIVELEAPGLDRSDFEVRLDGDVLTIEGETTDQSEQEGRDYVRQERMHGRFRRSFQLAEDVDPDEIHAEYQDGILHVELPTSQPSEQKTTAIE